MGCLSDANRLAIHDKCVLERAKSLPVLGVSAASPTPSLLQHDAGDYPIVLASNEGLVITNNISMGAAGVINLYVNVEFAEATAY